MNGLSSVVSHWRVLLRMVIRLSDYRCVAFCIERMMIYAPRTYFSLFPFFFLIVYELNLFVLLIYGT